MKECQSPPPPPPPAGSPLSMELCPGWPHIQMGGFFFFMGRVRQTCGRRLLQAAPAAGRITKFGTEDVVLGQRVL